jgi:hypothetical protein
MISGLSHRQAVELVHPFRSKGQEYTTYDERGVAVLRYLGYKVSKRYLKDFNRLKQIAVLSLHFPNETSGHVAIWDPERKKILEPYRGYQNLSISYYKKNLEFIWLIR